MSLDKKVWTCHIGYAHVSELSHWADQPLRQAVAAAFKGETGRDPDFHESGWGKEEAQLGLATSARLFEELIVRFQITNPNHAVLRNLVQAKNHATPPQLAYRTVDQLAYLTVDMDKPEVPKAASLDWCGPDECPIEVCNGPHVEHRCMGGGTAITRVDQLPCIVCGYTDGGSA